MSEHGTTGGSIARRLGRGSVAAFAIYIIGTGVTYGAQLTLARLMGSGSYGIYAYVFAWMTILAYLAALGFDVSLLRWVSAYRAQQAWSLLCGVIRYAERRVVVVGLGVVAAGTGIIMFDGQARDAELSRTLLIGLFVVPIWALVWSRSAVVRAFGGVASALAPDRVVRDGLLMGLAGVAVLVPRWQVHAPVAMAGTIATSLAGLGLVTLAVRHWLPATLNAAQPAYAATAWRRAAIPLVIIAIGETAMNRTGVILLGWFGDTRSAGIYSLAFNIAFMAMVPRMAINTLFAPAVSALFVGGDRHALQAVVARSALWTFLGAAAIALPLALFAGSFLVWFGQDFDSGTTAVRILLLGQVVAAGAGSQLFIMTMTGNERFAAALVVLFTIVNITISAGLASLFGLTGIAIAAAFSLVAWNVAMALFIFRKLQLVPTALAAFIHTPGNRLSTLGASAELR